MPPIHQAIQTTYHGPTNHRGARIKAKCQRGYAWHQMDDALSIEGWRGGVIADGSYVWVSV